MGIELDYLGSILAFDSTEELCAFLNEKGIETPRDSKMLDCKKALTFVMKLSPQPKVFNMNG